MLLDIATDATARQHEQYSSNMTTFGFGSDNKTHSSSERVGPYRKRFRNFGLCISQMYAYIKVLPRKKASTKLHKTTAANPVAKSIHTSHSGVRVSYRLVCSYTIHQHAELVQRRAARSQYDKNIITMPCHHVVPLKPKET